MNKILPSLIFSIISFAFLSLPWVSDFPLRSIRWLVFIWPIWDLIYNSFSEQAKCNKNDLRNYIYLLLVCLIIFILLSFPIKSEIQFKSYRWLFLIIAIALFAAVGSHTKLIRSCYIFLIFLSFLLKS